LKLAAIFAYATLELIVRRPATPRQRADWLHQFCIRMLREMGIATRIEGQFPPRGVVVSNHLGYLDIIVFAAAHPCAFVSKAELANLPLLGWMTTMAGTVYVERGSGGSALRARQGMQAAANAGVPVVFFPEGTTTDGSTLLPFHSGLLAQAIAAGQPVTAAHVRYRLTQDNGPGVTIRSHVGYWDDTPLFQHIFRLLAVRGIEVELRIAAAPIAFSAPADRKLAAEQARAAVMELGGVPDAVTAG
jgi:1-acyl-sn-glycerol-3-phosphate acyltransferase